MDFAPDTYAEPVRDAHGAIMFACDGCGAPITRSDILDLGLRLPDFGESAADYADAELIDGFCHPSCLAATKAG
jgi:hypothetical protein